MTMRGSAALALTLGLFMPDARGQQQADLARQAAAIRPTEREMAFLQIPWLTNPVEAFRLARVEQRPVLVYTITGDPIGDC